MVKITNGVDVFEVTQGAFNTIYSKQGYMIVEPLPEAIPDEISVPEKTEDEKFVEEIIEKPISQWNKEEIIRFATLKEIDISGTKNAGEAKEIIKEFMEEDE